MTKVRTVLVTAVLIVFTALIVEGADATSAIADTPSKSGNQLVGTWTVTVNRPVPLPPLKSVQVFTSSGAIIEMANESQASRTAQYGAWERIDGRLYAATALFYRFDAKGTSLARRRSTRPLSWGRTETPSSTSRG